MDPLHEQSPVCQIRNHNHNAWLGHQVSSVLITTEDQWGYADWGPYNILWFSPQHFSIVVWHFPTSSWNSNCEGVPCTYLKKKKKRIRRMKEPIAESFDFIFSLVIPYRNNMNNDDVHLNRVRPTSALRCPDDRCSTNTKWWQLGWHFCEREALVWSLAF